MVLLWPAAGVSGKEIHPEAGEFLISKYAAKTYGASPQNWAALQDQRGIMYFGNTEGLLEFDGVQWRRIALPNASTVRSLGMDSKGTVYVGGQGEFGYMAADGQGNAQFVSLLEKLAAEDRKFGDVWSVVPAADGIYFSSTGKLIRWKPGGAMKTWKSPKQFRRAYLIDGVVHVQVREMGLHRLRNDELELAPGGDRVAGSDVSGVFRHGSDTILATTNRGCFRLTPTGMEDFPFAADTALKESTLYSVQQLARDLLAIGTKRGGLLLVNTQGKVLSPDQPGGAGP